DRYLLLIGLSVFVLNMVNTTGDFILAQMVSAKASALAAGARRAFIGAFYGDFQTWVSVLTAAIQILVVGRIFKKVGVGRALVFLGVHLGMHVFGFAVVNVVAGMIWIGLAVLLRRRQAALAAASGMRAATAVVPAVVPASAPQGPGDQRIVGAVLR